MSKSTRKTPGGSSNKPTLDDILGRAKSTLNQSRQFRDGKVVGNRPPSDRLHGGSVASESPMSNEYGNRTLPVGLGVGLGSTVQLRKPGTATTPVAVLAENVGRKRTNYESSHSGSSHRDAISTSSDQRRHSSTSPSGSSISSANDSDSTITPPTITDTPLLSSKSRSHQKVNYEDGMPVPRDDQAASIPYSKPKGKNLLERTLLVRGDPVSNESYAVLKAMMFEKEHEEVDKSYTEDWVSETARLSDSIEVPETATGTEEPEIPSEASFQSESMTMKDTRSSLIVEEIMENLQDLDVSDQVNIDYDDDPIPSMEEQIALSDLEAMAKKTRTKEEESISVKENHTRTSTPNSKSVITSSKTSKASSRDPSGSRKSNRQAASSSNAVAPSRVTITSSDRVSSRKNFQGVLSKVKLEEEDQESDEYVPPVTKPQRQIQYILEKEVYQKELKRIRSIQKKEETKQTKIKMTKAKNLATAREAEVSGITYKEPAFTKVLLPELIQNPVIGAVSRNPSNNLGAPYFNRDGSLGMDYAIENYPRTPDENFNNQVQKMDIPQLVREVLASNERMYKMTKAAAKEMGQQYGKNAKSLLKMKTKELHRGQDVNPRQ